MIENILAPFGTQNLLVVSRFAKLTTPAQQKEYGHGDKDENANFLPQRWWKFPMRNTTKRTYGFFGYRCPTTLTMYKRWPGNNSRHHFLSASRTHFSLVMSRRYRVRLLHPLTTMSTFFNVCRQLSRTKRACNRCHKFPTST